MEDDSQAYKPGSLIEQYFGGTFDTELKCIESEDEAPTKGKEEFLQLSCFISTDVKYMHSGLRSKMQEQITKMSATLGRDALYTKTVKYILCDSTSLRWNIFFFLFLYISTNN